MFGIETRTGKKVPISLNIDKFVNSVREATNNEPWGASTTLMQEIAIGTYNYTAFNEIMPIIYRRFTEKSAEEWRQIYKALQLLEFLVKHGSERVIDDARSHISIIKILRNFHYIDAKGKDCGINVCNRAKELVQLLSDNDLLKQERKKAKMNKEKYTGISSDDNKSKKSCKKYDGFGSERSGTFFNEYNDSFCTNRKINDEMRTDTYSTETSTYKTSTANFEEYNEFDDIQYKSFMHSKNSTIHLNSEMSTISSKNSINTALGLLPFVDDYNSGKNKLHKVKSFKDFQNSINSSIDEKFDEFQSAAPPFKEKSASPEYNTNLLLSNQFSNDLFSTTGKYTTQSNLSLDQLSDNSFMISQSKDENLMINFANFNNKNIHTEKLKVRIYH
ncbi:hypothetical protein PCANB_000281 [Pneumocystis canis]|nr:hypothetical protein PCANB_000281 [Pneumocystis canis]